MIVFRPKWANFGSFRAKMSLTYTYYAAKLCKKPEKTYERILRSRTDEQTDGQE